MKLRPRACLGVVLIALGAWVTVANFLGDYHKITMTFTLDGKDMPPGVRPIVTVDNDPPIGAQRSMLALISPPMGPLRPKGLHHQVEISAANVEPVSLDVWTFFGDKELPPVALQSSKGSLVITTIPKGATVKVSQNGNVLHSGSTPLTIEKLVVGDYEVATRYKNFEERNVVRIAREQRVESSFTFPIGTVDLASDPPDAEYVIWVGDQRRWQGKLPVHLEDIPVGKYRLETTHKGWTIPDTIEVVGGKATSRTTKFGYGNIEVTSEPVGVSVSVGGADLGKTPASLKQVQPGHYPIIASDGENTLTADIEVSPGQTAKQPFVFRYGTVDVTSKPAGATVKHRGRTVGVTPAKLTHVAAGDVSTIEIGMTGYASESFEILGSDKLSATYDVKLFSDGYVVAMREARTAVAQKRYRQAADLVAAALKLEPDDPRALRLQSEIVAGSQGEERARREAERKRITEIIERAIAAAGGRQALQQLASFKSIVTSSGKRQGVVFGMRATMYFVPPDKVRIDEESVSDSKFFGLQIGGLPVAKSSRTTVCLSGEDGWQLVSSLLGPTEQPLSPAAKNALKDALYEMECESLAPLLGPEFTLTSAEPSSGAPTGVVAIKVHREGRADMTLFFNEQTGVQTGMEREIVDEKGNAVRTTMSYSTVREFYGVRKASVVRMVRGDDTVINATLESLQPWPAANTDVFKAPGRR